MTAIARTVPLVIVALLAVALAGCGPSGAAEIEGVEWRLVASSVSSADLGAAGITARFEGGLVGGTGGVNSYSAPYEVRGGGRLMIGDVTSTLIAAVDEERNAAESAYFALLGEVTGFRVEDDTLMLLAGQAEALIFER